MTEATINKKQILIPANWEEIQAKKKLFHWLVSLFFLEMKPQEILNLFAFKVFKINKINKHLINSVFEKKPVTFLADELSDSIALMTDSVEFIFKEKLVLSKPPFFSLFKSNKLYSTYNFFADTEIWEYALIENSFIQYSNNKDVKALDTLVAIIFRKKQIKYFFKNGSFDIRKKFDDKYIKENKKRISKIDLHLKWLVYRWFAYERELIVKHHPSAFKKSTSKNNLKQSSWIDVILDLSEFGDEIKTSKMKLPIFMKRLDNSNKKK